MLDSAARANAQNQWNNTPCGRVDGDPETVSYFDDVATVRYSQQNWQHGYFRFSDYRGKDVLEIGVGHGTDLLQFAKAGAICHGVDITDSHLVLTARNFSLRGLRVDLHKQDATALPFADASMDCVYSFGVVHHIPEIEKVIAEIHRALKPGGVAMIAVYNRWSLFTMWNLVLMRGLLMGKLFRLGWDGLKATIETGADGKKIKPYVRLYSKKEFGSLFAGFDVKDLSVHQAKLNHLVPGRMLGRFGELDLPLLSGLGWYVTVKAQKSGNSP